MPVLPYVLIGITMASGLVAFFFAKNGEKNKVSGMGWVAAALIVIGGSVAGYKTYDEARKKQHSDERAVAAEKETIRARAQSTASQDVSMSGMDLKADASGSFYFDAGTTGEQVNRIPGFIGPFPDLPKGATGMIKVEAEDAFAYTFKISPDGPGALRITSEEPGGRAYRLIDPRTESPRFDPLTPTAALQTSSQGEEEGAWSTDAVDFEFGYYLAVKPGVPLRGLVDRLLKGESFGKLVFRFPGAAADPTHIAAAYAKMAPYFMFGPAPQPRDDESNCHSRVRMRLLAEAEPTGDPNALQLVLKPAPEIFKVETCGYTP